MVIAKKHAYPRGLRTHSIAEIFDNNKHLTLSTFLLFYKFTHFSQYLPPPAVSLQRSPRFCSVPLPFAAGPQLSNSSCLKGMYIYANYGHLTKNANYFLRSCLAAYHPAFLAFVHPHLSSFCMKKLPLFSTFLQNRTAPSLIRESAVSFSLCYSVTPSFS